jgi:Uma2 family endonuclease
MTTEVLRLRDSRRVASLTREVAAVRTRSFSSAEYHAMAEAGILGEGERIELIQGEIVRMTPIGSRHLSCVNSLNGELSAGLHRRAIVSVQNPIALAEGIEPQPDLAILRLRDDRYRDSLPNPMDVLLVIEVGDASLDYDRTVKLPLYAKAGIPETWLVRLRDGAIEAYRRPGPGGYEEMSTLKPGQTIASLSFPDLQVDVGAILG